MKDNLNYPYLMYLPISYRRADFNEKDMRQEYSRLRRISKKRITRLKNAGVIDRFITFYELRMPKLNEIKSKRDLSRFLSLQARFLLSPMSSLTGRKKSADKAYNTLREHGYNINRSEIQEFGKFMDFARSYIDSAFYDSARAADYFSENYSGNLEDLYRDFAKKEKIPINYKPEPNSSSSSFR